MVFGGNECLACSALHPSYFLPYFSLIGFKVGGVNAEKGVSYGIHKARLLTYAMGEWGICSARQVVWQNGQRSVSFQFMAYKGLGICRR